MSRIGKAIIVVPEKVELEIKDGEIMAKGPLGELSQTFDAKFKLTYNKEARELEILAPEDDAAQNAAFHGLYRSLIANLIEGVNTGFKKILTLNGVGYRAQASGKGLQLSLGFSHPVEIKEVPGIQFEVDGNEITVKGIDKQKVGQTAANIMKYRDAKKDPYKHKGINLKGRWIQKKSGKKVG